MSNPQNAKPALAAIVGLLVAGAGAGFFLLGASDQAPAEKPVQVAAATQSAQVPTAIAQPSEPRDQPVVADPSSPREAPSKASRLARDLEREQIWTALGREHDLKPAAPGSAAPSESAAELLPALNPEYVNKAIAEQLLPVAHDCYLSALRQDPKLAGTLFFNFTLIGDEEIGGVVEEVEIGEESTLDSEFVRECLRESLMAVTFDPPPDGGRAKVTYGPLTFEPDE